MVPEEVASPASFEAEAVVGDVAGLRGTTAEIVAGIGILTFAIDIATNEVGSGSGIARENDASQGISDRDGRLLDGQDRLPEIFEIGMFRLESMPIEPVGLREMAALPQPGHPHLNLSSGCPSFTGEVDLVAVGDEAVEETGSLTEAGAECLLTIATIATLGVALKKGAGVVNVTSAIEPNDTPISIPGGMCGMSAIGEMIANSFAQRWKHAQPPRLLRRHLLNLERSLLR